MWVGIENPHHRQPLFFDIGQQFIGAVGRGCAGLFVKIQYGVDNRTLLGSGVAHHVLDAKGTWVKTGDIGLACSSVL